MESQWPMVGHVLLNVSTSDLQRSREETGFTGDTAVRFSAE